MFLLFSCGEHTQLEDKSGQSERVEFQEVNDSTSIKSTYYENNRLHQVETLINGINEGIFKSYRKDGSPIQYRTYKFNKLIGALTNYNLNGKLMDYHFIWENCGVCDSSDASPFFSVEYDTIGQVKSQQGHPIVEVVPNKKIIRATDSLKLSFVLAKPEGLSTQYRVFDVMHDTNTRLMLRDNPPEFHSEFVKFESTGLRDILIEYFLVENGADSVSKYTYLIKDIEIK
jgi:hypothetical protein